MAVAYQTHSSQTYQSATNTVVINKPADLAVGDLMVAFINTYNNDSASLTINVPEGWTAVVASQEVAGAITRLDFRAVYKIAVAADVAASNFTFTSSGTPDRIAGMIYRVSGQGVNIVIDSANAGIANDTASPSIAAGVTPTRVNDLLLMFGCAMTNIKGNSNQAIATSNPGWTEDVDILTDTNIACFFGAHATRPETTPTGSVSWANGGDETSDSGIILIAIAPTLDANVSMDVTSIISSAQDMTIVGGGVVAVGVISSAISALDITAAQAKWNAKVKSTAITPINSAKSSTSWVNTNKSTAISPINLSKS